MISFFNKNYSILISFLCLTQVSCQNHGKLKVIADMPSNLEENSGIQYYGGNSIWVVEDNGNKDEIYKVNFVGKIIDDFEVKNAKNNDWEDLAKDNKGNLYIGDFGNNGNNKKELTVYKLSNPEVEKGDKIDAEKIKFNYPEQKDYPPKKSQFYYDTEAFFHWGNSLYLITKNRTRPYDGKAMIYKVPDTKGEYEAQLVGTLFLCNNQNTCSVTSAAISSDGKTIVLLSYGLLWTINDFELDDFSIGNLKQIDLGVRTQLESVCFLNESTLLLSDERSHGQGGNLYSLDLNQL